MDATATEPVLDSGGEPIAVMSRLDILEIMNMIPHRHPMLMIDRLEDLRVNESAVGIKNVSINEDFFRGHFPARPVMPGVLIIEAMAQTAAVVVVASLSEDSTADKLVYFMSIENARFRRPVVPGDQLRIHTQKVHQRRNVWKFSAQAKVDEFVCAEATFSAMLVDA